MLSPCTNVPDMQPGKRSRLAVCQSDSLIQLPSWLFTPPAGMGMVSLWFLVTITVLLSTRATSFGSVRANQLQNRAGNRSATQQKLTRLPVWGGSQNVKRLPVLVFGKLLDHPFDLQTGQDVGRFLGRPRHHVHTGGLALGHCSLHKISHRRGQRGDGGQGANPDARPDTAMSEREAGPFSDSLLLYLSACGDIPTTAREYEV